MEKYARGQERVSWPDGHDTSSAALNAIFAWTIILYIADSANLNLDT